RFYSVRVISESFCASLPARAAWLSEASPTCRRPHDRSSVSGCLPSSKRRVDLFKTRRRAHGPRERATSSSVSGGEKLSPASRRTFGISGKDRRGAGDIY